MPRLLFDCLHNRDLHSREIASAPLTGEVGLCLKCGCERTVIGRSDVYVVDCIQCRYILYTTRLNSEVRASKHMITRKHRVHRYRQDTPDVKTLHQPDIPEPTLFDQPPF